MHELSISNAIATVVLEHADGRRVESVQVRLGALRQIVPESLTFCWEIVSRRPLLAGSVLRIEQVPGVVHCTSCERRSTLTEYSLRCPACGDGLVRVVAGEECLVVSIDLAPVDDGDAVPSDAVPSDAVPSDAVPSDAVPSDTVPSDTVPSDAVPSDV